MGTYAIIASVFIFLVWTSFYFYGRGFTSGSQGVASNGYPFNGEVWKLVDILIGIEKQYYVFGRVKNRTEIFETVVIDTFRKEYGVQLTPETIGHSYRIKKVPRYETTVSNTESGNMLDSSFIGEETVISVA